MDQTKAPRSSPRGDAGPCLGKAVGRTSVGHPQRTSIGESHGSGQNSGARGICNIAPKWAPRAQRWTTPAEMCARTPIPREPRAGPGPSEPARALDAARRVHEPSAARDPCRRIRNRHAMCDASALSHRTCPTWMFLNHPFLRHNGSTLRTARGEQPALRTSGCSSGRPHRSTYCRKMWSPPPAAPRALPIHCNAAEPGGNMCELR